MMCETTVLLHLPQGQTYGWAGTQWLFSNRGLWCVRLSWTEGRPSEGQEFSVALIVDTDFFVQSLDYSDTANHVNNCTL